MHTKGQSNLTCSELTTLLVEFDRAYMALIQQASNNDGLGVKNKNNTSLIARLIPKLDPKHWEVLSFELSQKGWLTFPIDPAECNRMCSLPQTQLHPHLFQYQLEDEITRAHRHNTDLALVLLGGMEDLDENMLLILTEAARMELAGGDTLARVDDNSLAIIAPGAKQMRARSLAERILDRYNTSFSLQSNINFINCKAGISCLNLDVTQKVSLNANLLKEQAKQALDEAKANQAKVHQNDARPVAQRSVLVQSGEKHFLFFGNME